MSRYRKISVCIWNDSKFRSLPDDAKLAFIFVLTHPHMTSLGAMRANIPGLACELDWPSERLREAFDKATGKDVLRHDERASCVFLPNFVKHNPPESPNVVSAWVKCLDDIPECGLKNQAIQAAIQHAEGMSEAFRKPLGSLREAFGKGMPNQEQEQEQEQEQDRNTILRIVPPSEPNFASVQDAGHVDDHVGVGVEEQTPTAETKPKRKAVKEITVDQDFNQFWTAYPRKKSKGQAQKTWGTLRKGGKLPDMTTLTSAIAMAAESPDWQRDAGKFIPYPSSWLNAHGWEDEHEITTNRPDPFESGV